MGIPVLHGVEGESAEIVSGEDVGVLFEPESAVSLRNGICQLVSEPALLARFRRNGPEAATHYDRQVLAAEMRRHVERAVTARKTPRL